MFGFFWLLSAVFLSCSEKELDVTGGKEITTSVTVEVPEVFRTRAVPAVYPTDVKNYLGESGYPSIGNVDLNTHPLTFTVGVYVEKIIDSNPVYTLVDKQSKSKVADDKANFNFRLMKGQSYRIVAYADFSDNEQENLDNISIVSDLNDELKDAFFVSQNFMASDNLTVVLKRPFGKLRLIARDFSTFAAGEVLEIETIKVTYGETATALATNSFNAITGKFNEITEDVTKEFTASPVAYAKEHEGDTPYAAVFTMYLPANFGTEDTSDNYLPVESGTPVPQSWMYPFDIEVTYKNELGKLTAIKRSFDIDIPVKRNWLTTIDAANFWTDNSNITVSIDHRFEGFIDKKPETVVVKNEAELRTAIGNIKKSTNHVGRIVLGADITLGEYHDLYKKYGMEITGKALGTSTNNPYAYESITVYLDLHGHTIKSSEEYTYYDGCDKQYKNYYQAVFMVRSNGHLIIEDSDITAAGKIDTRDIGVPIVYCYNGGKVTVNSGKFCIAQSHPVIYSYDNVKYIDGYAEWNVPTNGSPSIITINGGWFENINGLRKTDKDVVYSSVLVNVHNWTTTENPSETPKAPGYVHMKGGSYMDFNPATGDNVWENKTNKWVDDDHIVLTETVDGRTVYTVVPKNSPEEYD
ncbi:DUF6562 domain-containing protein [Bacteroides ovatus]|uniref:DUF6562 domain-containing protein n=1 Tax=Bacteroides ovatus TaxID=28116 RepID=UPI0036F3D206